jgi:hypothetical protein
MAEAKNHNADFYGYWRRRCKRDVMMGRKNNADFYVVSVGQGARFYNSCEIWKVHSRGGREAISLWEFAVWLQDVVARMKKNCRFLGALKEEVQKRCNSGKQKQCRFLYVLNKVWRGMKYTMWMVLNTLDRLVFSERHLYSWIGEPAAVQRSWKSM